MPNAHLGIQDWFSPRDRTRLGLILFYAYCFFLPFGALQRLSYGSSSIGLTSVLILLVILFRLPETLHSLVKHKVLLLSLILISYIGVISLSWLGFAYFENQLHIHFFLLLTYLLFTGAVSTLAWNREKLLVVSKCILAGLTLCAVIVIVDGLGWIDIPRINDFPAGHFFGQFGHRSLMAVYLAPMLTFLFVMNATQNPPRWFSAGVMFVACVFLFLLLLSLNRSGPAAILLSVGFFCMLQLWKERRLSLKIIPNFVLPFAVPLLILVNVFPNWSYLYLRRWVSSPIVYSSFPDVVSTLAGFGVKEEVIAHIYEADLTRWSSFMDALSIMQNDHFGRVFAFDPHTNLLTDIIYAGGIVGILLLLLIVGSFLSRTWNILKSSKGLYMWPVLSGLIAWLLVGVAYSAIRLGLGWGFIGMAICLYRLDETDKEAKMQGNRETGSTDFLNVIYRWKGLIIGGTLVAAAAALVVSLVIPKNYEVFRTLKIGNLLEKAIEDRESVIGRLKDPRALKMVMEKVHVGDANMDVGAVPSIDIDPKTNPNVRYTVRAHDPEQASRIADLLASYIIKTHQSVFERAIQITREHEKELTARIRQLELEVQHSEKLLNKVMTGPDNNTAIIILLRGSIDERAQNIIDLRGALKESRLSRVRYGNTSVIAADVDVISQQPVTPNVKLNVLLAGTLGFMMFTFVAFFLEYIEKAKGKG